MKKEKLSNLVSDPLSNFDLDDLLKDVNETLEESKQKINIFTPKQMESDPAKFKKKFNENGYCILFLNPDNLQVGHWVIMFKNPSGTYFFDSYGSHPKYLDAKLFKFLIKHYPKIIYNTFQYQKYSSSIATCGRWSMFVLAMNKLVTDLNVDILHAVLKSFKKQYKNKSYDQIVASFVNDCDKIIAGFANLDI